MTNPLQQLLSAMKPVMAESGFTKRKSSVFTRRLTDDCTARVGLAADSNWDVWVTAGLRDEAVERLLSELTGLDDGSPTVMRNLGELMPQRRFTTWRIAPGEDLHAVAQEISEAVVRYGEPFWTAMLDPVRLQTELEQDTGPGRPYQLPAFLLVHGHIEQARAVVDQLEQELAGRDDPAGRHLRGFLTGLRSRGL